MKYKGTLIAVKDMSISKRFYHDVLGLEVISDLGVNVTLSGGLSLQTLDTWKEFIEGRSVNLHSNAIELYLEETDIDAFVNHLQGFDIEYVHGIKEYSWKQRVIRFYDPNGHIIEVGESMEMIVRRFRNSGMTDKGIAERMDVPLDYVRGFSNDGKGE